MKVLVIAVVAVLIAAGLGLGVGWSIHAKLKGKESEATPVRIESASRGDLVEVVSAPGEIEPKTKVSISARLSARIMELPYEEGDRVTKGGDGTEPSVLVRLDASDLEAALRSAEAHRAARAAEIEVARAGLASQEANITGFEASLEEATRNLERYAELHRSGDVSLAAFEDAKYRVDELRAQKTGAEHQLASRELNLTVLENNLKAAEEEIIQARDRLSYTCITSPIDGTVTKVNANEGELVVTGTMNNPGTVVMEVADLGKMLVVAQVDEADVGDVRTGARAVVRLRTYPDEEFVGEVVSVALVGSRQGAESKFFRVEILLQGTDRRVFSGLTAEVDIEVKRHTDVLRLPSQAVLGRRLDEIRANIEDDNPNIDEKKTFATVVYLHKDGKAVVTPVKVGPSDATHTVIEAGLNPGDAVITGPYKALENLKHDQKVRDEKDVPPEEKKDKKPRDGKDDAKKG